MTQVGLSRATGSPFETAEFHRRLNAFNHTRFEPAIPNADWAEELVAQGALLRAEGQFVEESRKVVSELAARAPHDPSAFVCWFEELELSGPGQGDPLFPWLAEHASLAEMSWFLEQEVAGEAGFDDLVALTQLKMPERAKVELARNYWDEMGQGHETGMHGPMLTRLSRALRLHPEPSRVVWESLALCNLMSALASNRRYAYHAVGALGAIELTAPGRATCVNAGLKRLGIAGEVRQYFALHATLDVKHSAAWNMNVLYPLVEERPVVATAIAEGALLRMTAGARCFERYRHALWPNAPRLTA
jgi:hypothetical protein